MTTYLETLREKKSLLAREALERARSLRRARKEFGIDRICHHIKDVDGDWLEKWSDPSSVSQNC